MTAVLITGADKCIGLEAARQRTDLGVVRRGHARADAFPWRP